MYRHAHSILAIAICLLTKQATAVIVSSGDVKPPFALTGPSSSFTVPAGGSTSGGVYVGDVTQGVLNIDDAWSLNSTFGIISNGVGSNNPNPSQVNMTGGSAWNMSLDLDIGHGASGNMNLSLASSVSARSILVGTTSTAAGQLNMLSNSSATSQGPTIIGEASSGSLTASGGVSLTAGWFVLGDQTTGVGMAQFLAASALHTPGGGVYVGGRGLGTLTFNSGSTANALFTSIGEDVDSSGLSLGGGGGDVFLAGAGTFYDNTEGFVVGFNARGSATLSVGARLDSGYLEVSRYSDNGSLSLQSGAKLNLRPAGGATIASLIFATNPGSVALGEIKDPGTVVTQTGAGAFAEVGRGGSADVTVSNGAIVNAGYSLIATDAGSSGNLTVSGAGTAWHASDSFEVGRGGSGTLVVDGGAAVTSAGFLLIGGEAGGSGELHLLNSSAGASSLTTAAQVVAGLHGTALVTLQDGSRLESHKGSSVTSTSGLLAQFGDSVASVFVSDAGSLWTSDGGLNVGFRGNGTLSIGNGGRVESVDGIVARIGGAQGTVSMSGANSTWAITNDLFLGGRPASGASGVEGQAGPGGTALLTVGSGSRVNVGNSLRLFSGGQIDVSGGGIVKVGSNGPTPAPGTVYVGDSSTMYASGNVKGALFNDGYLYVGEGIGTLNVQGTFRSTDTLYFDVASTTNYDKLVVTGLAQLDLWLNINLIGTPTFSSTDRIDIISAGSISGLVHSVTNNRIDATHWLAVIQRNNKVTLALGQPGDATLDGAINFDDLLTLAMNYGSSSPNVSWRAGDFDGNGIVDFTDLLKIAQRYGTTYLENGSTPTDEFWSDWALARSLVPEPSMLGAISFVAVGRRRRDRKIRSS